MLAADLIYNFCIMPPAAMKYLYKYMPPRLDRIGAIIVNNKIHFSSPLLFNDAFDCATTVLFPDPVDLSSTEEEALKRYYHYLMRHEYTFRGTNHTEKGISDEAEHGISRGLHRKPENHSQWAEGIKKEVNKFGNSYRILCLTTDPKNILMWSHYAHKNKGVALQFRKNALQEESGEDKCHKVDYCEQFPTLQEYVDIVVKDDALAHSKLFYCRKFIDWEYEQEYRLFVDNSCEDRPIPDGVLSGIIFGCSAEPDFKEQILAWNNHRATPLAIYYAVENFDTYGFKIVDEDGKEALF